jgi:hypothetical protein
LTGLLAVLPGPVPDDVAEAVGLVDELGSAPEALDPNDLARDAKPGKVGAAVTKLADSTIRAATFEAAAKTLREPLQRRAVVTFVAHGHEYLTRIGERFDAAAEAFTDAAAKLPARITPETVVSFTGPTLIAWDAAKTQAGAMSLCSEWRNALEHLGVFIAAPGPLGRWLPYGELADASAAQGIVHAVGSAGKGSGFPLEPWLSVLRVAGVVRLRWASPAQVGADLARLTAPAEPEPVGDRPARVSGRLRT